ncbi:MAG: DUF488 family protein, N3 subclade [Candidatus Acidiferrales bacterium]
MRTRANTKKTVFTIGHSTRSFDDFVALIRAHGVKRVIDIRTIPRSRHNPQFNRDAFGGALRSAGIGYVHLKKLGGLRHAKPDSTNMGWRNKSFRGYADYMQTPEFEEGLARAIKLAAAKPSALMCAEAVPWRCHRSLVADALIVRGYPVEDIISGARAQRHKLTPFARVRGTQVTYPGDGSAPTKTTATQGGKSGAIHIARVYEKRAKTQTTRYLVERLWPRGMKKSSLHLDAWLKDVAPSTKLREWFGHKPERWKEFQKRYLAELRANPEAWKPILNTATRGDVTLLYSAHDTEHNAALVLQKFLVRKFTGN